MNNLATPPRPDQEITHLYRAFNQGADARLAGWPDTACRYSDGSQLHRYWLRGWREVDAHWGEQAHWPIVPLREVVRHGSR